MNCQIVKHRLDEYVDGDLPLIFRYLVKNHLKHCNACKHELSIVKDNIKALSSLSEKEYPMVDLWPHILANIQMEKKNWEFPVRRVLSSGWRYASLAAFVIIFIIVIYSQIPTIQNEPPLTHKEKVSATHDQPQIVFHQCLNTDDMKLIDQISPDFRRELATINQTILDIETILLEEPTNSFYLHKLHSSYYFKVALICRIGKLVNKLDRVTYSVSALSLFFAVDMDLRAAGLDSGNFWLYDNEDVDGLYKLGMTDYVLHAEEPASMFLTVTTLKDPSKMHDGIHTCEAFTFVDYAAFEKWSDSSYGARPAEYEAEKEALAEKLFRKLEKFVPGITKNIVFWNLATPLTNEHYINATRGNQYGISKSRRQVGPGSFPIRTEIEGLFLCGANTVSHGVAGVTASGLMAAKSILGCKTEDLLKQNGAEMKIYPSEDISAWPENLQKKIEKKLKEF